MVTEITEKNLGSPQLGWHSSGGGYAERGLSTSTSMGQFRVWKKVSQRMLAFPSSNKHFQAGKKSTQTKEKTDSCVLQVLCVGFQFNPGNTVALPEKHSKLSLHFT